MLPAAKVGIPPAAKGDIPLDEGMFVADAAGSTGDGEDELGFFVKEERRFCAEDFLRIVGRGMPSAGPPDNAMANAGPENEDIILDIREVVQCLSNSKE